MANADSRTRIGPAGWSYPDWDGIVYPAPRRRSFDPLAFLASYFDLIEINSTFYRAPSRATCARWADRVDGNPAFLFTAKAPRDMTHGRHPASERDVAAFQKAIEPLLERRRLGAVLIQFSWSFRDSASARAYVRNLNRWFDPFPTAFEVRHGSWGKDEALPFFRESGITLCGIDQPAVGDSLPPATHAPTADRAYFRLHGRNTEKWFSREANRDERYDYTYEAPELSFWRNVVRGTQRRSRQIFVVLNNHFRGQAVVNAFQLKAMLAGRPSPAPDCLIAAYPKAGDLLTRRAAPPQPVHRGGGRQIELFREEKDQDRRDDSEDDE